MQGTCGCVGFDVWQQNSRVADHDEMCSTLCVRGYDYSGIDIHTLDPSMRVNYKR